jgi:hypothetical protein
MSNLNLSRSLFRFLPLAGFLLGACASRQPARSEGPQAPPVAAPSSVPSHRAPDEILKAAATKPSAPFEGEGWRALFDGKTLAGWRETQFSGRGEVESRLNALVLNMGDPFTGVNWTNEFPNLNYEVALDAMRVAGSDFFCALTVPVGDSFCSLIVGGWGGSLVGISSIDSMDASENETTKFVNFEQGRWYRIRLRISEGRIEGWIDKEKLVDVVTTGKRISLRAGEIEQSKPFGIAAWQSTAALREIRMRRVNEPADPPKK